MQQLSHQRWRRLGAAVSILGVLSGQICLRVPAAQPARERQLAAPPRPQQHRRRIGVGLVPYPHGLALLDVAEGTRRGDPFPAPQVCGAAPHVPYPEGFALLAVALEGVEEQESKLGEMRRLARVAANPTLDAGIRAQLDEMFLRSRRRIDQIAASASFQGIQLLDGTEDACLEGVPVFVDLPDTSGAALGLSGATFDLSSATNASASLSTIDTALDSVLGARVELIRAERSLTDGPADGGLREQSRVLVRMRELAKQAAVGTLNSGDRFRLDSFLQDDLARIESVAENVAFQGIELLDGSTDVTLQGPPPHGKAIFVDLPDATVSQLGIDGSDLLTFSNAIMALAALDAALTNVNTSRDHLRWARRRLQ